MTASPPQSGFNQPEETSWSRLWRIRRSSWKREDFTIAPLSEFLDRGLGYWGKDWKNIYVVLCSSDCETSSKTVSHQGPGAIFLLIFFAAMNQADKTNTDRNKRTKACHARPASVILLFVLFNAHFETFINFLGPGASLQDSTNQDQETQARGTSSCTWRISAPCQKLQLPYWEFGRCQCGESCEAVISIQGFGAFTETGLVGLPIQCGHWKPWKAWDSTDSKRFVEVDGLIHPIL